MIEKGVVRPSPLPIAGWTSSVSGTPPELFSAYLQIIYGSTSVPGFFARHRERQADPVCCGVIYQSVGAGQLSVGSINPRNDSNRHRTDDLLALLSDNAPPKAHDRCNWVIPEYLSL